MALVDGARQLGFELTARGNQDLTLKFLGAEAKFQVLNVMEFSSDRGRMSVIVRSPDGTIRLLVKGSDAKMLALLRPDTPKSHLEETNKNLHLFATQASPSSFSSLVLNTTWQRTTLMGHLGFKVPCMGAAKVKTF